MTPDDFIARLGRDETLDFEDTMAVIEANYRYTPAAFDNGGVHNAAGQNEGSCKIFAFALRHGLDREQTLACFGRFHRDVLATPEGEDHANIRAFMRSGPSGLRFHAQALQPQ